MRSLKTRSSATAETARI